MIKKNYIFFYLAPPPDTGCVSNNDCGNQEICRDRACVNPCVVSNPCAQTAQCTVNQHRTSCTCPAGTTGDPFRSCYPSTIFFYLTNYFDISTIKDFI